MVDQGASSQNARDEWPSSHSPLPSHPGGSRTPPSQRERIHSRPGGVFSVSGTAGSDGGGDTL